MKRPIRIIIVGKRIRYFDKGYFKQDFFDIKFKPKACSIWATKKIRSCVNIKLITANKMRGLDRKSNHALLTQRAPYGLANINKNVLYIRKPSKYNMTDKKAESSNMQLWSTFFHEFAHLYFKQAKPRSWHNRAWRRKSKELMLDFLKDYHAGRV